MWTCCGAKWRGTPKLRWLRSPTRRQINTRTTPAANDMAVFFIAEVILIPPAPDADQDPSEGFYCSTVR